MKGFYIEHNFEKFISINVNKFQSNFSQLLPYFKDGGMKVMVISVVFFLTQI